MQYKSAKSISNSSDERFLAKYLNFARLLEREPGQLIQAVHSKIRHKIFLIFAKMKKSKKLCFDAKLLAILSVFMTVIVKSGSELDVEQRSMLFGKDVKPSKIVLKNNIGYHFKKIVREVSQELFISRKINVAPILEGLRSLKNAHTDLETYCADIPNRFLQAEAFKLSMDVLNDQSLGQFIDVGQGIIATFHEAKAKCEAFGLQLPEIYTEKESLDLVRFLRSRNITACFAGIEGNLIDKMQYFIATGYPIWYSWHKVENYESDNKLKVLLDDTHARFVYTKTGKLRPIFENGALPLGYLGKHNYWESYNVLEQAKAAVICSPKWDGTSYGKVFEDKLAPGVQVTSKAKRATARIDIGPLKYQRKRTDPESLRGIISACKSLSAYMNETYLDYEQKFTDLLSQVDISVHEKEINGRNKRSLFVSKFFFKTGARLVWDLFGFLQNVRVTNRLKKVEKNIAINREDINQNSQSIQEMSVALANNSITIGQLQITSNEMRDRIRSVEERVKGLESALFSTGTKLEIQISLFLIQNLANRIDKSLGNGYELLQDIVHSSLKGHTSPLVLPSDQIEEVQSQIRHMSPVNIDTAFSRMNSIVISHPMDNSYLLVVVNAAAISHPTLELVHLIPVPYYKDNQAFSPVLDYKMAALDQLSSSFTILDPSEEEGCLNGRCYISGMAQPVNGPSCGIPQYFDRNINNCEFETVASNGIFLQAVIPDGIIFSFREKVSTQTFCKDGSLISEIRKLSNAGVMQLPTGCLLSVTDDQGRNVRLKGQPKYVSLDGSDINLGSEMLLQVAMTNVDKNVTVRKSLLEQVIDEHLLTVSSAVKSTRGDLLEYENKFWIVTGSLFGIIICLIIILAFLYWKSNTFRLKVKSIRDRMSELGDQVLDLEKHSEERDEPPPVPIRPEKHSYLKLPEIDRTCERIYSNTPRVHARPKPIRLMYPDLDQYDYRTETSEGLCDHDRHQNDGRTSAWTVDGESRVKWSEEKGKWVYLREDGFEVPVDD